MARLADAFLTDDRGGSTIEFGLLAAFISTVIYSALTCITYPMSFKITWLPSAFH